MNYRVGWTPVLRRNARGRRGCADSGRSRDHERTTGVDPSQMLNGTSPIPDSRRIGRYRLRSTDPTVSRNQTATRPVTLAVSLASWLALSVQDAAEFLPRQRI